MIQMKSDILTVKKLIKKTKAEYFRDLKIGDRLQLNLTVNHICHYAPEVNIDFIDTGEYTTKSFNQLSNILKQFEFEK